MQISLSEPSNYRYVRINPATNRIHLLVPFVAGQDIGTDNTCQLKVELKAFFEGGAFNESHAYESTLEFHSSLMEEGPSRRAKEERLAQIKVYLKAIRDMREGYNDVVKHFLKKPSNLYSMQLRPSVQDPYSVVVNPVFTINRGNDSQGTPISALFNAMHEAYRVVDIALLDPKSRLEAAVLNALPTHGSPTFAQIQAEMTSQYQRLFDEPVDFSQRTNPVKPGPGLIPVTQTYIDTDIRRSPETTGTTQEYIEALWGTCCVQNIGVRLSTGLFYSVSSRQHDKAETLSMMTQFFLAHVNIYCTAKGISHENFGVLLDSSPDLSSELVGIITSALIAGVSVEEGITTFFNKHSQKFALARPLMETDKQAIQKKFEITYRTISALKENPHMDDFIVLDTDTCNENNTFIPYQGLICTDFANIVSKDPNQSYFDEIRQEARTHPKIIAPQDEATITIDTTPEALMDKLSDVQWERLPKEVVDACRAVPAFKVRQLLDNVAKGKQDEADAILESAEDKQTLLRTSGRLTDYSGRDCRCTPYQYAYWAKDKHMCRMLERHMDDETKALMLEKVTEMEHSGLAYQQGGQSYKNPHYDMSFVLKNLSPTEFLQVQKIARHDKKIQQATQDNYQKIAFTATEYEALKKVLEQHKPMGILSYFFESPAQSINDKLQFDFHSLITALDTYVTNYNTWDDHAQTMGWMSVGKAQRDVVAHIAHEYCRPNRLFNPIPAFNEETLPRVLTCVNHITNHKSWFPLSASTSGLGFDFTLMHADSVATYALDLLSNLAHARMDLAALRHLDEVRIADLTQSRDNLSMPAHQLGLR